MKNTMDNEFYSIKASEDQEDIQVLTIAKEWYAPLKGLSMDDWNDKLKEISIPFHILKLPKELVYDALNGKDVFNEFDAIVGPFIKSLGLTSYFVKAISRSPKDYLEGEPNGYEINNSKEAYNALFSSMRTFEDFVMLYKLDKCEIVIRPFISIPKQNEFRVYVYGKQIVGISQYFYYDSFPEYAKNITIELIEENIRTFVKCFVIPAVDKNHFVVDVVAFRTKDPIVIELNPFGLSDPCLFGSYSNLDGSFKYRLNA